MACRRDRFATASFPGAIQEGREELLAYGSGLDRPILLLQAGMDTVVDPDDAEALWSAITPRLLERHLLKNFRHEIFHDIHRAEAQAWVEPWLEALYRTWLTANAPKTIDLAPTPAPPLPAIAV